MENLKKIVQFQIIPGTGYVNIGNDSEGEYIMPVKHVLVALMDDGSLERRGVMSLADLDSCFEENPQCVRLTSYVTLRTLRESVERDVYCTEVTELKAKNALLAICEAQKVELSPDALEYLQS